MKTRKILSFCLAICSAIFFIGAINAAGRPKTADAEPASETVIENTVKEDAYVRSDRATTNYNYENITQAHGSQYVGLGYKVINAKYRGSMEIYPLMKFDIPTSAADEDIDTYYLQFSLFKNADYLTGDQDYVFCYSEDVSWSETTVKWENKPSSINRNSQNVLAVFSIKQGYEYENKTDEEKTIRLDITQPIKNIIANGTSQITVFAYAKNNMETSILIHSKETSDENKRAKLIGVNENITTLDLQTLISEGEKIDGNNYTQESFSALSSALTSAKTVLASSPDRPALVSAYKNLKSAMQNLSLAPEIDKQNLAYGKNTRSNLNKSQTYKAVDGDDSTYWSGIFYPSYIDVDLGDNYEVNKISVTVPSGKEVFFSVYASEDGKDYTRIEKIRSFVSGTHDIVLKDSVLCRIIRVYMEYTRGEDTAYISEIKAYGQKANGDNSAALRTGSLYDVLGILPYSQTEYADKITEQEIIENVYGIIDRTIGRKYRSWFTFELLPYDSTGDYFTIKDLDGKIYIGGNIGLSLTTGLNYCFKNYLNVHVSEQTVQAKMPESIPKIGKTITKETTFTTRYAFNYCTLSYTFAFFDESNWQRENDWLALSGVNLVLDLAGQEATWIEFLMNFGYSFDDAKDWLTGPSYYAWQFMDNMESFGGPIPDGYIIDRVNLARKTQRWKNSLGIQTIMQGYAGMLPTNFNEFMPDTKLVAQGGWNGFTRPSMIATDSKEYDEYSELFYKAQEYVLGTRNHYYAVDPFHEGGKRPAGLTDDKVSQNVLESLIKYDPQGVWVVQAWQNNPTNALLKGMGEYRNTNVLIADLIKYPIESWTKYDRIKYGSTTVDSLEFNSTNWIWTLVASFGGNPSMHGQLKTMADSILSAKVNYPHMKGLGVISEATYDNPVVYDLIFDLAWADENFNLDDWLNKYIERRYGGTSENAKKAWNIMKNANYNYGVRFTNEVYGMKNKTPQSYSQQSITYGADKLETALTLLLADFDKFKYSECYLYDLTEIMRQVVSNYSTLTYNSILTAKNNRNLTQFIEYKDKFLKSLEILDEVQSTQVNSLAGEWIGKATDIAQNYDDFGKDVFEMNAKALITSWGSRSANRSLKDYGWRNYQGMFTDLYANIWEEYLTSVENNLKNGSPVLNKSINDYFDVYWQWNLSTQNYTRTAKNSPSDLLDVAQKVLESCMLSGSSSIDAGSISSGRSVSANTTNITGSLSSVTDGNENTQVIITADTADGKTVEPEIIVDLIGEFQISKIVVLSASGNVYALYAGNDAKTWTEISEVTSAGENTVEVTGQIARFIKLKGKITQQNPDATTVIKEIKVYGERILPELDTLGRLISFCNTFSPDGNDEQITAYNNALNSAKTSYENQAAPDELESVYWTLYDCIIPLAGNNKTNIAVGKKVTAHNDPNGNSASLADNDTSTHWDSGRLSQTGVAYQEQITPGWAIIDLEELYDIYEIDVILPSGTQYWHMYELYVSTDMQTWVKVGEKTSQNLPNAEEDYHYLTDVTARYVKICTTNIALESSGKRAGYLVKELAVYGAKHVEGGDLPPDDSDSDTDSDSSSESPDISDSSSDIEDSDSVSSSTTTSAPQKKKGCKGSFDHGGIALTVLSLTIMFVCKKKQSHAK